MLFSLFLLVGWILFDLSVVVRMLQLADARAQFPWVAAAHLLVRAGVFVFETRLLASSLALTELGEWAAAAMVFVIEYAVLRAVRGGPLEPGGPRRRLALYQAIPGALLMSCNTVLCAVSCAQGPR